jgi:hypothetical protein
MKIRKNWVTSYSDNKIITQVQGSRFRGSKLENDEKNDQP